jgi:uncharacterized membrane protein YuzA (DUF378 family)
MKNLINKVYDTAHIWTNIAYVIAGLAAWQIDITFAFILLGFTSFMGHWKGGKWWIADWAGMYTAFIAIILHNFELIGPIFVLAPIIFYITFKYLDDTYYFLVGVLWFISIFVAVLIGINAIPSIIMFALALLIRQQAPEMEDKYYNLCHGTWHMLTAIGMLLLV